MKAISSQRNLLQGIPERLKQLAEPDVERKLSPTKWSAKEELGHLLDSAANNHQRIVRAQLVSAQSEDKLAMPGYDQNGWVAVNRYQQRPWDELIETWLALNRQLLAAAESVPEPAWSHTLTVAGSEPMTLQFVFEDYIAHMAHHLEHIGVEVRDLTFTTAA
jgi:hypothetical protein